MPTLTKSRNPTVVGSRDPDSTKLSHSKGQKKMWAEWRTVDSPKKRTNEFVFFPWRGVYTVGQKPFIRLFFGKNLLCAAEHQSAYRFIWPLSPKHFIGNSCVYFFFVPNLVATREFEKNCSNQILQASADPGTREKFVLYKQKTSLLSSLWHRWSCMSLCCQNGGNCEH